jgi:hypothetical protein
VTTVSERSTALEQALQRGRLALVPVVVFGLVGLASWSGGYGPTSWGWMALAGLWTSLLVYAWPAKRTLDGFAALTLSSLGALTAWTAVSIAWSFSRPETAMEIARTLVYFGCIGSLLLLVGVSTARALLVGVSSSIVIVSVFALGLYFLRVSPPDATQGTLLFRPVGYANALGGLVALSLPLLLAFAVNGGARHVERAAASAALVPVVTALYLTQSRAAWFAAALALAYWILRASPRASSSRLVASAIAPGIAVGSVALLHLTRSGSSGPNERWRYLLGAFATVVSTILASAAPTASGRLQSVDRSRFARRALGVGSLAGIGAAATEMVFRGLGDRSAYWRVAWQIFTAHPLYGAGAGAFAAKWLQMRPIDRTVLDAHNLYLETLAELGAVGLLLLVTALALPLVAGLPSREPALTAAVASYWVFVIHAFFEWDWEMPVVTLTALAIGVAILAGRTTQHRIDLSVPVRAVAAAVTGLGLLFAFVSLVGAHLVARAEAQMRAGDPARASETASGARRLLPWASTPWLIIGDADLLNGDDVGARHAYRQALRRDPNDWESWLRLSLASSSRPDSAEARKRALHLNPRALERPRP